MTHLSLCSALEWALLGSLQASGQVPHCWAVRSRFLLIPQGLAAHS